MGELSLNGRFSECFINYIAMGSQTHKILLVCCGVDRLLLTPLWQLPDKHAIKECVSNGRTVWSAKVPHIYTTTL